jgi:putative aldouronate transport system substrate-binding protein
MKKMSTRRIVALFLVAMLGIAAVMTGCGQAQQTATEATTTAASTEATEATTTAAPKLEPVEISWYVVNTPQKDTDAVVAEVNKMLAEKTNINTTLKLNVLDWGSYNDKVNVMLQAGEPMDICFTAPWINNYLGQVGRGAFLPLDELIDQYGQEIKTQVPAKYLDGVRVNGKIYGVPHYQGYAQPFGVTFRKDLVDKYGFDYKSIKEIADLEPYFETIKKNEPGIIPYMPSAGSAFNAYVDKTKRYVNVASMVSLDTQTGKYINSLEIPELMVGWKLLRSWYQKGYIAKDAATRTDLGAECKSGKYAVLELTTYFNDGKKTSMDYQYPTYDIPLAYRDVLSTDMISVAMSAITKNSKNPDRAMMLINAMWANKDIYNVLGFGIEGKHWNWKDQANGVIEQVAGAGYDSPIHWEYGSAFNKYLTPAEPKEDVDRQLADNDAATPSPLLGFNFNAEPVKNEIAQIDAAMTENDKLLYSGSVDPEKVIPALIEKMKKLGFDKVAAEAEKQINEWKAATGK